MRRLRGDGVDLDDEKAMKDTQLVHGQGFLPVESPEGDTKEHSLIFCSQEPTEGNHCRNEEEGRGGNGGQRKHSLIFSDEPTQDDTFGLQNKPEETPFLNKLRDPFEKDEDVSNVSAGTPGGYRGQKVQARGPFILKDLSFENAEITSDLLAYDNGDPTQRIHSDNKGTIEVSLHNNRGNTSGDLYDEMQKSFTGEHDTQVINPARNTNKYSNIRAQDTDPDIIDSSPQMVSVKTLDQVDYSSSPKTDYDASSVQIPQTIERLTHSRREVVNTQEEVETSSFHNTTEFNINSNQKSFADQTFEEVKTDDEKDPSLKSSEKETEKIRSPKILGQEFVDHGDRSNTSVSVVKARGNSSYENNKNQSLSDTKQNLFFGSPSEIEESSPLAIKKMDILQLQDSSSKTDKFEELSEVVVNRGKLKRERINVVSSPTDSGKNDTPSHHSEKELSDDRGYTSSGKISSEDHYDILRDEDSESLDGNLLGSVSSVWAFFNLKVYTGIIREPGDNTSVVEFEEGSYIIKNSDLYMLDIRIGDKVRLRSSHTPFIVVGLSKSRSQNISCVRGYNYVHLKKLTGKNKNKDEEIITPLSECYMEVDDWIYHQQKFKLIFHDQDILKTDGSKLFLDKMAFEKSNIGESASEKIVRTFRSPMSSPSKDSNIFSSPRKRIKNNSSGKIFSGMLFGITSLNSAKKETLIDSIEENGGSVLNAGFHDTIKCTHDENHTLVGEPSLQEFKFAALLSDSYCRSAKYLQTLALGWPILSEVFIYDCVKEKKCLSQWPYLLPAGHSNVLGSLTSTNVFQFRYNYEKGYNLSQQTKINGHLLNCYHIILITDTIDQTTSSNCKFIFHAFGCKSLITLKNAKETLDYLKSNDPQSKGILIYDDGTYFKEFLEVNGYMVQSARSGSRPSSSRYKSRSFKDGKDIRNFGLVDWEWLVQCVISSNIWKPVKISITL